LLTRTKFLTLLGGIFLAQLFIKIYQYNLYIRTLYSLQSLEKKTLFLEEKLEEKTAVLASLKEPGPLGQRAREAGFQPIKKFNLI
jgi:hypothetical protein